MSVDSPAAPAPDIDAALTEWRQGDCVLGEQWFVHRFDPAVPVTSAAREAAAPGQAPGDLAETMVHGFLVLTQTCDIARKCAERHYVEVCPLVEVSADDLKLIKHWRKPAYVFVHALEDLRLVGDLDRTMTVEKPLLATWRRTPGWTTAAQLRSIADALARKRSRFAFPDDFDEFVEALADRIDDKHRRNSAEGRALRELDEIRVQASPTWEANQVELMFWFILENRTAAFEEISWQDHLARWLALLPARGRFREVHGQVAALRDLNADEYVHSDRLDLERLSHRDVALVAPGQ